MPKPTRPPPDRTLYYWFRYEVCAHFRIHRNTLARWIETRGFPKALHDPSSPGHTDKRGIHIPSDEGRFIVTEVLAWGEANFCPRPANDNISPEDRRKLIRFIDE